MKVNGVEYCCRSCYIAEQVCNKPGCCGNPPELSLKERMMSKEIEVEKTANFLPKEKIWGVSLRTVEPYGQYRPDNLYVTACFHKDKEKAFNIAWKEFYKAKQYQDDEDARQNSRTTEVVKVAA